MSRPVAPEAGGHGSTSRAPPARTRPRGVPAGAPGGAIPLGARTVTTGSRRTSRGSTSSRTARYFGCRILPSAVHSVNATSTTISGRVQCGRSLATGRVANGQVVVSSGRKSAAMRASSRSLKPGPVWATWTSASPCQTPSNSAPK